MNNFGGRFLKSLANYFFLPNQLINDSINIKYIVVSNFLGAVCADKYIFWFHFAYGSEFIYVKSNESYKVSSQHRLRLQGWDFWVNCMKILWYRPAKTDHLYAFPIWSNKTFHDPEFILASYFPKEENRRINTITYPRLPNMTFPKILIQTKVC